MILALGIVIATPGLIIFGLGIWHSVFGPTFPAPGTTRVNLGTGTYLVFERTGNRSTYGPVTVERDNGVTIDAGQVRVTGPEGEVINVRNAQPNESIDRDSNHYTSAVKFTTNRSGTYTLRFDTTAQTSVMVQRPFGDVFSRREPWAVDVAVGWFVALVGMTMLLAGVIRRGRAHRAAQVAAAATGVAPAGWFADPLGVQRLRYWDGDRWTDHVSS